MMQSKGLVILRSVEYINEVHLAGHTET
jgi:hypothetical protein